MCIIDFVVASALSFYSVQEVLMLCIMVIAGQCGSVIGSYNSTNGAIGWLPAPAIRQYRQLLQNVAVSLSHRRFIKHKFLNHEQC